MNKKVIALLLISTAAVFFVFGKIWNKTSHFNRLIKIGFIHYLGVLIGFYVIEENNSKVVPDVLDVKTLLINEISADRISENLKYVLNCFECYHQ